jgi:hypothetical protein
MPNYTVGVHLTYYGTVEVEADTPEEAMEQVKELDAVDIAISSESANPEYAVETAEEG